MDNAEFFEQLQSGLVREKLAVRACGEAFYAGLDLGDGIDRSLDRALHLMPTFIVFFEKAAEEGSLPEDHSVEEWGAVLEEINEGTRSPKEPSDTRKAAAGFLLRQEVRTREGIIPTSLNRRQEFKANSAQT